MGFYAGFDLGGSNARILLTNESGEPLLSQTGSGISMKMVTEADAYDRFLPLVQEAVGKFRPTYGGFADHRLLILNDCEVLVYQYEEPAIVLTAGTGSIAFGRVPGNEVVRCGGWGRMLSDEGSGFDMGLRVLRMIGNHLDGRVSCPVLYRLFCKRSTLRRPADIDSFAFENLITKKEIADFAPLLIQAAEQDEALAKTQLEECIAAYVSLVVDTFAKMSLPMQTPVRVLLWGGILTGNAAIAASVANQVKRRLPGAMIVHPHKDALRAAVDAAMKQFGNQ